MYLIPPTPSKRKYTIRFRNHDGRNVKVAGDEDRELARRIGERVQMLVSAKHHGDPPPAELIPWIDNMPKGLSDRLIELGLLAVRHVERNRPLTEWIEPWVKVVQDRNPNAKKHPPQQGQKLKRIIAALNAVRFSDLDADAVTEKINAFRTLGCKASTLLSTGTRRSYFVAVKDFADWLSRKLKVENPLKDMEMPSATEDVQYERMPLTVTQFRALVAHLDTFERYRNQNARWNASDRKLIYWTAAKTGYREGELAKLCKFNLYLDENPPIIGLKARHTKNKARGEVPIPHDLADALRAYVADLNPEDQVFRFPATSGSVVDMLRRDLDGAGIPWKLPSGEIIDFHSFRHTAITWWLEVDGLTPKRVQVLARLKTLALVQNYSRNMRIEDFGWLNKGPKLVPPRRQKATS
jgi:integrase